MIAKDGEVISQAYNTQRHSNDASAHAEINAIRLAGKKMGSKNLEGCTIYCTCEPCIMCLSAIAFAKIPRLVYGLSLREVSEKSRLVDIELDTFLAKALYKIEIVRDFMKEECRRILT